MRITAAFKISACIALAALASLPAAPAMAIPAPDLIVSSVSGISQLLAMLSIVLGGSAFVGGRSIKSRTGLGSKRGMFVFRALLGGAGLLLVASVGLNVWQWQTQEFDKQSRLQATLNRPAIERGKPIHDPTLRELPYSKQISHPLRIETSQVAALLSQKKAGELKDYLFIDSRENIEVKSGSIEGFTPVRSPDFWAAVKEGTIDIRNKKIVVICHNGNRSFELAEDLATRGVPAWFVAGGFEKWLVEDLPVMGSKDHRDNLRSAVPYPNDKRLLDTPDVRKLIANEDARVIDVRYEREFDIWHVPDAINIPMRKMTTLQLADEISKIPRVPLLIACYDRRGCFGARVLGYELHRAGHDFRGHYPVPWEYYEQVALGAALPHVAAWQALANQSLYGRAKVALSEALYSFSSYTSSILWSIVALALLSRLIVLPVTFQAERDQMKMLKLKPRIAELRKHLAHDQTRLMRAVRALHKQNGINPYRGLLTLIFLPLFLVSIAAIELTAAAITEGMLWIDDLSQPDPLIILPAMFGALILFYMDRGGILSSKVRPYAWLIGMPLLAVTMLELAAAANIYAVLSAALVILQREIIVLARRWPELRAARFARKGRVIPLRLAHYVPTAGIKANRLGQLIANQFPVPTGVVIPGDVYHDN